MLPQSLCSKEMFILICKHCLWMCSGALKCFVRKKKTGVWFCYSTPRNMPVHKSSVRILIKINKFNIVALV